MSLKGYVDIVSRSLVAGWAGETARHETKPVVIVEVNGAPYAKCVADIYRPDMLKATGGEISDHSSFRLAFDPPLSAFLAQTVRVAFEQTGETVPNGSLTLAAPRSLGGHGRLTPIMVTTTGRSGSTLLMSEFAANDRIVVAGRYPFEIKQIAYHAAAFRALVGDADRVRSTDPDTMLAEDRSRTTGSNPFNDAGLFDLAKPNSVLRDYFNEFVPNTLASNASALIAKYYELIGASQGKASATHFCEKTDPGDTCRSGARVFFGSVREIVVMRDPRDLLCSAIDFWKLPPAETMRMLASTMPQLAAAATDSSADTLAIRYEDLVLDGAATRRRLSGFLDLDVTHAERQAEIPASHLTSTDPIASIGRWRHDLTPVQVGECEAAFGGLMQRFDYPRHA